MGAGLATPSAAGCSSVSACVPWTPNPKPATSDPPLLGPVPQVYLPVTWGLGGIRRGRARLADRGAQLAKAVWQGRGEPVLEMYRSQQKGSRGRAPVLHSSLLHPPLRCWRPLCIAGTPCALCDIVLVGWGLGRGPGATWLRWRGGCRLKIDDPCQAAPTHLFCGTWGGPGCRPVLRRTTASTTHDVYPPSWGLF